MVAPPARKTVSPRSAERRTGVSLVLTLVVATLVVSVAGAGTAAANAPVDAPGDASPVADAGSANGLTNATLAARTAGDARFSPSVVREERGDVMTIPVHTSKAATVNLGSPEVGFCLAVGVGKGTTKLAVNTYETGDPTTMVTATKGTIKSRTRCGPMPRAPLDVATYPMNVTIGGEEEALGTFIVTERRTEGATGLVAPRETDPSEVESVGDVESVATPLGNATVASGDWFVYRVDASGLGGFLEKGILDGDGEDVTVRFEQVDGRMNVDPKEFTGDTAAKLLAVPDSETYFLFVDTAEHDIEPGERYDARFTVGKSNPLVGPAALPFVGGDDGSPVEPVTASTFSPEGAETTLLVSWDATRRDVIDPDPEDDSAYYPREGRTFVPVKLRLTNAGGAAVSVSQADFLLEANGTRYGHQPLAGSSSFEGRELVPGDTYGGWTVFSVPENAPGGTLVVDERLFAHRNATVQFSRDEEIDVSVAN